MCPMFAPHTVCPLWDTELERYNSMPNETELPEYTQTLNELIATKAHEWDESHDLPLIVKMMREQSARFNVEQALGSRKRVTSKQIANDGEPVAKKPTKLTQSAIDALKSIKV